MSAVTVNDRVNDQSLVLWKLFLTVTVRSQRLYLPKQLREIFLAKQLDVVFQSVFVMRIAHAAPDGVALFLKSKMAKLMRFLEKTFISL